ncbi:MAG: cytochrome c peroxidase [Byssovorax sp.]
MLKLRRALLGVGGVAFVVAGMGALVTGPVEGGGSLEHDPRVELGRRLFFDPAVSKSGDNSCASCHEPAHGFSSPKKRNQDDFTGTRRHSQPLLDMADGKSFHWDGEFRTVAELVTARLGDVTRSSGRNRRAGPGSSYGSPSTPTPTTPFFDPQEPPPVTQGVDPDADAESLLATIDGHRLTSGTGSLGGPVPPVAERIQEDGRYADGFQSAFGSPRVTVARVAQAIEAYVETIRSTDSPFDRHLAGDKDALSSSARRGLALFKGRAGCVSCHRMDGLRPRFTDESFHNTGVSAHAVLGRPTVTVSRIIPTELLEKRDPGRHARSRMGGEMAAFKTPTLRDVALRPPYMHDGGFQTLEDVVRYYVKGATPDPALDEDIKAFDADDRDVADLVEFMHALTGKTRAGLAATAGRRADRIRLRLEDKAGRPIAGMRIVATPDGDVVPVDASMEPVTVVTDANGFAMLDAGPRTHLRLSLPGGLRPLQGSWVPDTCRFLRLRVPVLGQTSLLLTLPAGTPASPMLAAERERTDLSPTTHQMLAKLFPASLGVVRERLATFTLDGTTTLGGKTLARYRAWLPVGAPPAAVVDVPLASGRTPCEVRLAVGGETRLDLSVASIPPDSRLRVGEGSIREQAHAAK